MIPVFQSVPVPVFIKIISKEKRLRHMRVIINLVEKFPFSLPSHNPWCLFIFIHVPNI